MRHMSGFGEFDPLDSLYGTEERYHDTILSFVVLPVS